MSFTLAAKPRTISGRKVKNLRAESTIPAVVYGLGVKNEMIQVNAQEMRKIYQGAGENQVVELAVEGRSVLNVLIRDIQINPIRREITHADFYAIDITKPVEVQVPLEFTGEAPAVKLTGGSLVKKMAYIKVRCLPKDFVKLITVPVDGLTTLEDVIAVKDLVVPKSWTILEVPTELVATVVPPRLETEDVKPADAEAAVVAAVNAVPAAEGEAGDKKEGKDDKGGKDKAGKKDEGKK